MNKKPKYRGKYPGRLSVVIAKNGVAHVMTNSGDWFVILAADTGCVMPRIGQELAGFKHTPNELFKPKGE